MTKLFLTLVILSFLAQETFSCSSSDCGCFLPGSVDNTCDRDGKCNCKPNFYFTKCDQCARGYYWFPKCWKGCDVNDCQFMVVGFEDEETIHELGYEFSAPGIAGDEGSYGRFDLFVDTNKKYKNMIGGMVGIKCMVWLYGKDGSEKSFQISRFGGISHRDNANINISDATFTVQTNEDHLVGLTDGFSVYIIKNQDDGWSVLKKFPSGSDKAQEWGDILCATIFDSEKFVVITTGPESRIMYFNLNTKDWTEGPPLGNLKKGVGSCSMLEETGHIFVKSPHINTVFDVSNGEEIENYFDKNELPDSMSNPTILKGKFGHALFGGSSDKVYYLPPGTKQWKESEQKMLTSLQSTFGCLYDKANEVYV